MPARGAEWDGDRVKEGLGFYKKGKAAPNRRNISCGQEGFPQHSPCNKKKGVFSVIIM